MVVANVESWLEDQAFEAPPNRVWQAVNSVLVREAKLSAESWFNEPDKLFKSLQVRVVVA